MADPRQTARPARLLEIVTGALELDPATRKAFLDETCAGDAALRAEAESLLCLDEPARDFIARPAIAGHALAFIETEGPATPAATLQPGQMLGDFRIGSLLGEGGMGEVYLAEDTSLGRSVAIKLVKAGIASHTLRQRLGAEKRILARLNDPHIARLYGGAVTSDGLPYFVMEYVEGEQLDDYCDKRRLPIQARLALFRKVCAAVAYAHQHLVIHRGLKPANIRVTPEGEPKLLDFGIAKLLDPPAEGDTAQTVTQFNAMTPGYASPEQLRGESVTTATDIYSLGVVLYELLCGHRPSQPKNWRFSGSVRALPEETVPRPSRVAPDAEAAAARGTTTGRLAHRLAGDLDNIVLMAMRPETARRYPSVSQLAEDIRRHLDGQPVTARKETLRYVGAKFVARNKALAAAAALVSLTLIGGIVTTTWQAHRADEQRRSADRRFEDVRRLANSLMGEIHDSVETLAGSTPTRKLIVARALEYLDGLSKEADKPELRRELAAAYEKIGNVQGNPYESNLGDTNGALTSYRKAESLLGSLSGASTVAPVEIKMALGRIDRALGDVVEVKGNYAEMIRYYRRSLEVFAGLQRQTPTDPAVIDELARAYITLGDGLERTENGQAEQLRCFEQALGYLQTLVAQVPGNTKYRRALAVLLMKLGEAYVPDKTRSVDYVTRAVSDFKAMSEADPDNVRARRDYAMSIFSLGWTLGETADHEGAVLNHRKALVIREQIAASDPKDEQARFDLAVAHSNLANALTDTGHPDQALDHARQAIADLEPMMATDPTNVSYLRNCGLFYETVSNALAALAAQESLDVTTRRAHWTDARTAYEKTARLFSDLSTKGPLRSTDAQIPASLTAKIAKCDEGLTRLRE